MKKKIILFHHEFCVSGGAEHTMFEVMDYLTDAGYDYTCYAPIVSRENCFPEKIAKYNIKELFPYVRQVPRFIYPILAILFFPCFLLKFRSADLFYGANQSGPLYAYIASIFFKKPFVIYMPYPSNIVYPRKIDVEFSSGKNNVAARIASLCLKIVMQNLDARIFKRARKVITEGTYALNIFKNIYKRPIENAPAGSDVISLQELAEVNKFEGSIKYIDLHISKPYILLTNRHVPKKKFEYAIKMLTILKEKYKLVPQLVITGAETEYTEELLKQAKQIGIRDQIICTGLVSEIEINNLYKNAAVYIYTAPEEDYGKGVVQAQSNGTPAVVWDTGGPAFTVEHNSTGFIAPFSDIEMYTSFVMQLLSNKQLNYEYSRNAVERMHTHFSKEKHREVVLTAIEEAMLY